MVAEQRFPPASTLHVVYNPELSVLQQYGAAPLPQEFVCTGPGVGCGWGGGAGLVGLGWVGMARAALVRRRVERARVRRRCIVAGGMGV